MMDTFLGCCPTLPCSSSGLFTFMTYSTTATGLLCKHLLLKVCTQCKGLCKKNKNIKKINKWKQHQISWILLFSSFPENQFSFLSTGCYPITGTPLLSFSLFSHSQLFSHIFFSKSPSNQDFLLEPPWSKLQICFFFIQISNLTPFCQFIA